MNRVPIGGYVREAAVSYARRWALDRNPSWGNFTGVGGDCANFVSQCLYAGCGEMNRSKDAPWYYDNMNARSPSWSGVLFLYRFLLSNGGAGPRGHALPDTASALPGDVLFLRNSEGRLYHAVFVLQGGEDPLLAAHTTDSLDRALSSYGYSSCVCVRVECEGRRP